jgi:hypothetical protein
LAAPRSCQTNPRRSLVEPERRWRAAPRLADPAFWSYDRVTSAMPTFVA